MEYKVPSIPANYNKLLSWQKKLVREQYIIEQQGNCYHCDKPLTNSPDMIYDINWSLFPKGFLNHPIHLHHDHKTGMTIGAVHAYCNAVLWQYFGE